MTGQELIFEGDREPKKDEKGRLRLLELQTNGIIPSRMRHVIKRYLKRAGFSNLKIEHRMGPSPLSVVLMATGTADAPVTDAQLSKLKFLEESLVFVMNQTKNGYPVHASQSDPELLRRRLAQVEPSLGKVYYAAPSTK